MTTACLDWGDRLQRGEIPATLEELPIETEKANKVATIFRLLCLPDLPNQPDIASLPNVSWVETCLRATFGDDIIREVFVCVGKKSGKTALFGLGFLAAFLGNKRPNAAYTILAPSVAISRLSFDLLTAALAADETLAAITHIRHHTKEIVHRKTGATLTIKAFSAQAITGLRGNVFVDELWVLGSASAGTKLRSQLKGALASDENAKIIYVTTTSDTVPQGVFADVVDYARRVRDGDVSDPSFLPIIWEPWPDCPDPLRDESVWPLLLPSYPCLGDAEFYRAVCREATAGGPVAETITRAQFFNEEPASGRHAGAWVLAECWPRLATERLTLDQLIARSVQIGVGIDLGGNFDLSALTLVGTTADGDWLIWSRAWCQQKALEANTKHRDTLDSCIADGDLVIAKAGQDIPAMVSIIDQIKEARKLHAVGVDPGGAADLADALEAAGYSLDPDDGNVMGIGQTAFRLNPAVQTLGRRAEEGRIIGDNSRLLVWSLGNVIATEKGAALHLDKVEPFAKIDPVAALLDAASTHILRRPVSYDVSAWIA